MFSLTQGMVQLLKIDLGHNNPTVSSPVPSAAQGLGLGLLKGWSDPRRYGDSKG